MANGPQSAPECVICTDGHTLSLDAAYRFTALSAASTRTGAPFSVALAGGKTPAQLYALLASPPFKEAIEWSQVHIFFGDERAVPLDSPFSNYRMAKETLIDRVRLPAGNVHRIRAEQPDPDGAAEEYRAELAAFFAGAPLPRFDLILLGMGSDGHCASLFPGSAAVQERSRWVVRAEPGLEPFVPRVSLTLPVINNAANVLFLVEGADKAAAVERVFAAPANAEALPARQARPTNGELAWLLDRAAAGL